MTYFQNVPLNVLTLQTSVPYLKRQVMLTSQTQNPRRLIAKYIPSPISEETQNLPILKVKFTMETKYYQILMVIESLRSSCVLLKLHAMLLLHTRTILYLSACVQTQFPPAVHLTIKYELGVQSAKPFSQIRQCVFVGPSYTACLSHRKRLFFNSTN